MNITEAIKIALLSLWANKLRSVLTLLGVVIGVAAVIAVVTFVNGINGYVAEKIFNLGADVFIVSKTPNVITDVDQFIEGQKRKDLSMEQYRAVAEECSACKVVGAALRQFNGKVVFGNQNSSDTMVRGWTPTMSAIYDLDLVFGRMINETDDNYASPVAIIGWDIRENLLGSVDPLGKEIRVDGRMYRVIGVGKKEGKTLGMSRDNYVLLPIATWIKAYGGQKSVNIWAKTSDVGAPFEQAIDQVRVRQFLIESVTLALIGGLFGVTGGVGIAMLVTLLIGMPSAIKLWAILAGLLVSASVGIFFGVYPARQAAKLDPIAALRFEL